jgi:DNA-binding MarR family transcriptional regulator
MDRRLAASGLTTQQAALLTLALDNTSRSDAGPTLGWLADRLGVSHQNVRQLVDALTRKGFCAVMPDAHDRRVKRVAVSPKVRRLFTRRNASDFAAVSSWFDVLSQREVDAMLRSAMCLLRSWDDAG